MFLQVNIKDGHITSGREKLKETIENCPDGIYTIRLNYTSRPKTVTECRNQYFFFCTLISNEGNTGYTAKDLHKLFKENVMPNIPNITSYVAHPMEFMTYNINADKMDINYSTKMLNLEGWYVYIEAVKQYAKENLDFLL